MFCFVFYIAFSVSVFYFRASVTLHRFNVLLIFQLGNNSTALMYLDADPFIFAFSFEAFSTLSSFNEIPARVSVLSLIRPSFALIFCSFFNTECDGICFGLFVAFRSLPHSFFCSYWTLSLLSDTLTCQVFVDAPSLLDTSISFPSATF